MTPLAKAVDLTLELVRVSKAAGISLESGRKFVRELAAMPQERRDALVAEAHRELIREHHAELRHQRSRSKR